MLTEKEKSFLLETARQAIRDSLAGKYTVPPKPPFPALQKSGGVFVTLTRDECLRGCIGCIESSAPLYINVADMAVNAASKDPRFPPVKQDELQYLHIEISVLSQPVEIEHHGEIVMGRDGVIVEKGSRRGVLLPQVAVETNWTKEEFMDYLCRFKAGLDEKAWLSPDTRISTFQAEVFGEKELGKSSG